MLSFVVLFLVLLLLRPSVSRVHDAKCTISEQLSSLYYHYQEGDLIIGGVSSHFFASSEGIFFKDRPIYKDDDMPFLRTNYYQHVLAMAFAVNEINENPQILPNATLGFHICNSYYNKRETYRATIELLSTKDRFLPNYNCDSQNNRIAVIGGLEAEISLSVATILSIYNSPQLTFGSTPAMNEKLPGFSIYRMIPNEAQQYKGILHLILHFRWTWVGLALVDDERGERFQQAMLPLFSQNGICFAFVVKILQASITDYFNDMVEIGWKNFHMAMTSKANAVVFYGDTGTISYLRVAARFLLGEYTTATPKVYIMTIQMDFASYYYQRNWDIQFLHGSIAIAVHTNEPPGFQQFLKTIKPLSTKGDTFIKDFWEQAFLCYISNVHLRLEFPKDCTGEEKLESLPRDVFEMGMTGTSYRIYNAVYAVAHALHSTSASLYRQGRLMERKKQSLLDQPSWQVNTFIRKKDVPLVTGRLCNPTSAAYPFSAHNLFINSSPSFQCFTIK